MHKSPQEQTTSEWLAEYDGKNITPIQSPIAPAREIPPSNDNHDEGVVDEYALIPDGEYSAWYLDHELHPNFKGYGDKLVISFSVIESDYAGEAVKSYYNITILKTGWKAKGGSRWVKEMRRLFPGRKRKDRLPPSMLKDKRVLVEVRTVTRGRAKRTLDQAEQYSVVANILRLLN